MEDIGQCRVRAIHPNWHGYLRLSAEDRSVVHEGHLSRGIYALKGHKLIVLWEKYDPDIFYRVGEDYVHEALLANVPEIGSIKFTKLADHYLHVKKISVLIPESDYEVTLRLDTTDIPTFLQVFIWNEYVSPCLPEKCRTIVDLGANIGLATAFFGLKYPDARILAVEPDIGNYQLMYSNVLRLGQRVQGRNAAVWSKNGQVNLHTVDEGGVPLGQWGVQTSERNKNAAGSINAYTLRTLLDNANFDTVDILKVDIEGAEREIFSNGAAEWLSRINLIIVETHDRFQPGSEEAVRTALRSMFVELPRVGENMFFRHIGT